MKFLQPVKSAMRFAVVSLLTATACGHTHSDRDLASPPRHPFHFPPVSASAHTEDDVAQPPVQHAQPIMDEADLSGRSEPQ